jgi:hypothetical protein
MSRFSRVGNGNGGRKLLVVHQQTGQFRLLLAECRGGSCAVLDARSAREGELPGVIATLAREHKPERILRIAPGGHSVCRCVEMPAGDESGIAAALPLLAEAELPENLPPHRRAAGVIPGSATEGGHIALLTAWRENGAPPPKPLTTSIPETWVTEVACLAMLRGESGAAIYADRKDGAISIVASGSRRTIARILVEDSASQIAWRRAVETAVEETLAAAAARAPMPEATDVILQLPEPGLADVLARAKGAKNDARWLSEYGLCLGAAFIAADEPLTSALAEMTASGVVRRRPLLVRTTEWIGVPRNAWILTAASVALLLLAPLGLAAARLAVLEQKARVLHAGRQERERLDDQVALYAQLDQLRWPMSKLMADIARATPVGVVIDDFRLTIEAGVTLQGSAEALEQLHTLQQNLASSGIFRDVKVNRSEVSATRVSFDLTADVGNPRAVPPASAPPLEDFAAKPLAVRLHGEGASNTAPPDLSRHAARPEVRTVSRGENGASRPPESTFSEPRSTSAEAESSRRPSAQAAAADAAPPPLTDEEIAAMNFGTTVKEWAQRKTAAGKATDEAVKQRLEEEVRKLAEHRDKVKGGGS